MANEKRLDILFPVGRLVGGSVYEPDAVTDANGQPKLIKTGDRIGQPLKSFYIPVAVPKELGHTHWAQTEWGAKIWAFAHAAWPQGQAQRADFAWKITDGDSTIPNKNNKRPCDQPGHPGHWILKFGGMIAPKLVNKDGTVVLTEPDAIQPGDFVQMYGSVSSNESTQTAGIYLNHSIVAFSGYDAVNGRISFGPDPSSVGFGAAPLPPGVSAIPPGGMTAAQAIGSAPPPPGAPSPATASPPVPGAVAGSTPPPPVPGAVTPPPSQTFTAQVAAPPPPVTAPAAPARVMLPAAGGVSYEAHIAAGWTDATLIAHGKMAP